MNKEGVKCCFRKAGEPYQTSTSPSLKWVSITSTPNFHIFIILEAESTILADGFLGRSTVRERKESRMTRAFCN